MESNINKYKALIVDDERLARKELLSMLEKYDNIVPIGEAEDVPSAMEAIKKLDPDVLFLDIQMPGQSGFDLIDQIDFDGKIIFVTAYDEYAIRAFEVNAMDYLLKPITEERLDSAIVRLEDKQLNESQDNSKLCKDDWLFLRFGNKTRFIKVSSIEVIEASADYSKVILQDGTKGLVAKSMKEWESRLPENFMRIHRSSIIHVEYVDRIEEWFNYSYRIYMKGIEEPLTLSRRFARKLKERFG